LYNPAELVVADWLAPVDPEVAVTVAFGITAPA
jgi:hypothetical protein